MLPDPSEMLHRREAISTAAAPHSYNAQQHTVEAVLSNGAAVVRPYGTEVLRISSQAVDLSRLREGGIPFLDHHSQAGIDQVLGRITSAWIERGMLLGRIQFNQTAQGQKAEGMVARGEIEGVSAGYRVDRWEITDADGNVIDPEKDRVRWDDDLTFTAVRWQLFECSLVGVPADGAAHVRSMPRGRSVRDIRACMAARQAIVDRQYASLASRQDKRVLDRRAVRDFRARMQARQAMVNRMSEIDV